MLAIFPGGVNVKIDIKDRSWRFELRDKKDNVLMVATKTKNTSKDDSDLVDALQDTKDAEWFFVIFENTEDAVA